MVTAYLVPFHAPVARGHGVLVVEFSLTGRDATATLVFDRTASNLYCEEELATWLRQDPALALTDPIALITRHSWAVKSAFEGVCTGTIGSTKRGVYDGLSTLVVVEPAIAPYR